MADIAYPDPSPDAVVAAVLGEPQARSRSSSPAAFAVRAGVIAAALLAAAMMAKAWPFTVDDAFITCRYSRNVADGLGATFNASGPRAEGYTTFAWMALLVVPHLFHVDAIVAAKALGVLATFGTLGLAAWWARAEAVASGDGDGAGWATASAPLLLAAIPATAVHAVSGMETALYTLLLTALFAATSRRVRGDAGASAPMAVLALLLGLTRPEGNFAAGVAIAACLALVPRSQRAAIVARAAALWVLPVAAYELCRWRYYGLPFPLPFYVKLGTPDRLPGWPDVRDWLKGPVLCLALPMLAAIARPPRSLWPALATAAALTAFFVLPQHQMGYEHRYLAPLDPPCAVMAGVGLARVASSAAMARTASLVSPVVARTVAAALLALAAGLELAGARDVLGGAVEYGEGLAEAHERLGRELRALPMASPGRLAIADAGAVPYLSGWWTVDLVGLNEAAIATTGRRDPDGLLAAGLDVVVLASEDADRFQPFDWNPWEEAMLAACTRAGFARVGVRRFGPAYWLWVLARPGSDAARGLSAIETARAPGARGPKGS